MDMSDAAIRHAVAFNSLNIKHYVEVSPQAISIAKEFRICVIAIVLGLTSASIVKSVLQYRRRDS